MIKKNLLIAGIDPGTTAAYALLGLDGSVVRIASQKELSLGNLIEDISSAGIPVVIGTDKKRVPDFIEKLAARTGARVVSPDDDMKVSEKQEITKGLGCRNVHEMDALASALFAFRRIRSLLKKIELFAGKHKKEKIADRIAELVLKNEMSIRLAAKVIEMPDDEKSRAAIRAVEKRLSEKDFLDMCERLMQLESENRHLKDENGLLGAELRRMMQKQDYLSTRMEQLLPGDKAEEVRKYKRERIMFLDRELKKSCLLADGLKREIGRNYSIFAEMGGKAVLKKLRNLGWTELISRDRVLKISNGDMLLVNNPNEYSQKTIDFLKQKVNVIVCRQEPGRKAREILPFIIISASKLKIAENSYFAFAGREDIEKQKNAKELLGKIISEYRDERAKDS